MTVLHHPPTGKTGKATRLKQYALFSALFCLPVKRRMRALNAMDSVYNLFGERTLYHNLGYWKDGPDRLDDACDTLAELLGEAVGMGPGDDVLDVGFGFGDQDLYWHTRFAPHRIVGVEVDPFKVRAGRERVAERGLADRIELRPGSATELPFGAAEFDRVLALECAFHFITREEFFGEAYRVLRPGGALALVEPIPAPGREPGRAMDYMMRSIMAIPKENMYPRDVYRGKLERAGFTEVSVTSIYDHVFPPFMRFLEERIDDPGVVRRVNPLVRGMWRGWAQGFLQAERKGTAQPYEAGSDYVLAVARKPLG